MTADGFELECNGDRGSATRTMRRFTGRFRVRARKSSMDWYRGDLLELKIEPTGAASLRVRTAAGDMVQVWEGSLDV